MDKNHGIVSGTLKDLVGYCFFSGGDLGVKFDINS